MPPDSPTTNIKTSPSIIKIALAVGLMIFACWINFIRLSRYMGFESNGDAINGINALFTGFAFGGVIITLWLQNKQIRESAADQKKTVQANLEIAQANLKIAQRADEQAIFDMFQTYCSEYFQGVKDSSMSVLIACVRSKEYCEFVASRLMVAGQLPLPKSAWEKVRKGSHYKDYYSFIKEEQRNRYKLDELINFFTLLVARSNSSDITRRCDFSYSWWRPLLWLVALQQEKHYANSDAVNQYNFAPHLTKTLEHLDAIYGVSFGEANREQEFWNFFMHHPKIASYGLDPGYTRT